MYICIKIIVAIKPNYGINLQFLFDKSKNTLKKQLEFEVFERYFYRSQWFAPKLKVIQKAVSHKVWHIFRIFQM